MSCVSLLNTILRLNLVLTCEIPPDFRGGVSDVEIDKLFPFFLLTILRPSISPPVCLENAQKVEMCSD